MRRTEKTFAQTRAVIEIENHFHTRCHTSSPCLAARAVQCSALENLILGVIQSVMNFVKKIRGSKCLQS